MVPSYDELLSLNSRLKNKSKTDINELIKAIISKGYVWEDKEKFFYNKKLGMHIRTEGLDLFTPESFARAYETWSNKRIASGMRIGQLLPNLLLIFLIDLCIGWKLFPRPFWLVSLFTLFLIMAVAYKRARKKVEMGKKEVKACSKEAEGDYTFLKFKESLARLEKYINEMNGPPQSQRPSSEDYFYGVPNWLLVTKRFGVLAQKEIILLRLENARLKQEPKEKVAALEKRLNGIEEELKTIPDAPYPIC